MKNEPNKAAPSAQSLERIRLDALTLLQGRQELEIAHRGEIYRLRMTRNGKLILTK
ncbi:hemin uptake protein HemP [Chitinimonas taiwanensis]|uniref:Hemin uptake protein hemP n=1 Tax=Chitinimonas taiwanensis DSM 18899 TaxID=1121279 RepID=A0A1K2HN53_9NEIS|nr:hemin uptake protein HemP [Chitinimonas taiwanensis]SFZ78125.1 Hemin uptake protein hemP [Chitinimonas taiwanensis DSM 18899]